VVAISWPRQSANAGRLKKKEQENTDKMLPYFAKQTEESGKKIKNQNR
jgi:hypothetical protein